jgi:putative ABC transport system substrate-binding protein
MKKYIFCVALSALLLAFSFPVDAQRAGKIFWIGYLAGAGSSPNQSFVQGLRDLGYVEGKNIGFVYRTTEGKSERYADLAIELVHLKVDVIVADGTPASEATKKATGTIPIIMTSTTDPVGTGLVASLARPGGNITGLTSVTGELGGKLLELLTEIVPGLSRVVIPGPPVGTPSEDWFIKETEIPARALKVQLRRFPVRGPEDFESIFRVADKERAQALLMRLPAFLYSSHYTRLVDLTVKNRLPAMSTVSEWVNAGGLMSYGPDRNILYRRAATYLDKILKGAKPAELPVEQPTKFELVINLKTAKQIGLTIPPNVLARADKVIR